MPIVFIILIVIFMLFSCFFKTSIDEGGQTYEGRVIARSMFQENQYYLDINNDIRNVLIDYPPEDFKDGDYIKITGRLERINTESSLNKFNYGLYLAGKNFFYELSVDEIIEHESNRPTFRNKILRKVYNHIKNKFGAEGDLIFTILFGIKEMLDSETKQIFNAFGLTHLLVVSGLHVSIIANSFDRILSRFKIYYIIRKSFVFILLGMIAFLAGFHISIMRAFGQKLLKELSIITNNAYDSMSAIAVLNIIFLIYNPYYCSYISYQLSFLAAFALAQEDDILHVYRVYLGILPIILTINSQVNILTIPFNIIMISIMGWLLPITGLSAIVPFKINFLDIGIRYIYSLITEMLRCISKIEFLSIDLFYCSSLVVVSYYFLFFIYFLIKENESLYLKIQSYRPHIVAVSLSFIIILNNMYQDVMEDTIFFFDVGNGDSALINYKNSKILIDAGSRRDVDEYLEYLGIKQLNAVLISHNHMDHYGGLRYFEDIEIAYLFLNDDSILKNMDLLYNHIEDIYTGDELKFGRINFEVFNPPIDGMMSKDLNDTSHVIQMSIDGVKILFTGDITKYIEKDSIISEIDILKVPHHGSKDSSTDDFLKDLNPKLSIVSVGRNNPYGHPHSEAMDRLEKYSELVLTTKESGTIMIKIVNENTIKFKFF
ncbi:MAG: ComEC/Rec2 family competence protein [Bacillota bacterium]|nr:ComEC/Rec2 family competence protein [Bacillota bacterium]